MLKEMPSALRRCSPITVSRRHSFARSFIKFGLRRQENGYLRHIWMWAGLRICVGKARKEANSSNKPRPTTTGPGKDLPGLFCFSCHKPLWMPLGRIEVTSTFTTFGGTSHGRSNIQRGILEYLKARRTQGLAIVRMCRSSGASPSSAARPPRRSPRRVCWECCRRVTGVCAGRGPGRAAALSRSAAGCHWRSFGAASASLRDRTGGPEPRQWHRINGRFRHVIAYDVGPSEKCREPT